MQKANCMLTFPRYKWPILRLNTRYNMWLLGSVSLFFFNTVSLSGLCKSSDTDIRLLAVKKEFIHTTILFNNLSLQCSFLRILIFLKAFLLFFTVTI